MRGRQGDRATGQRWYEARSVVSARRLTSAHRPLLGRLAALDSCRLSAVVWPWPCVGFEDLSTPVRRLSRGGPHRPLPRGATTLRAAGRRALENRSSNATHPARGRVKMSESSLLDAIAKMDARTPPKVIHRRMAFPHVSPGRLGRPVLHRRNSGTCDTPTPREN